MTRRVLLAVLVAALAAAGAAYVLRRQPSTPPEGNAYRGDGRVQVPRPEARDNEVTLQDRPAQIPTTGNPVEHTLRKVLAANDQPGGLSAFPKGTRLLDVQVANGTARVNLSREFGEVGNMGSTGESLAQNALRRALAQFPEIHAMRVEVEGRPFESEHSGAWADIPVRGVSAQVEGAP